MEEGKDGRLEDWKGGSSSGKWVLLTFLHIIPFLLLFLSLPDVRNENRELHKLKVYGRIRVWYSALIKRYFQLEMV